MLPPTIVCEKNYKSKTPLVTFQTEEFLALYRRKCTYSRGKTIPLCAWYFPFLSL
jgi:hypothetical protein